MVVLTSIVAGMVLIFSALFLILSAITYKRVRVPAMFFAIFLFSAFLIKSVLYFLGIFFNFSVNLEIYFMIDVIILIVLYIMIVKR